MSHSVAYIYSSIKNSSSQNSPWFYSHPKVFNHHSRTVTFRQKGRINYRQLQLSTREQQLPGSKPIAIVVKETVLIT